MKRGLEDVTNSILIENNKWTSQNNIQLGVPEVVIKDPLPFSAIGFACPLHDKHTSPEVCLLPGCMAYNFPWLPEFICCHRCRVNFLADPSLTAQIAARGSIIGLFAGLSAQDLPVVIGYPPSCQDFSCGVRHSGSLESEAITAFIADELLSLPQVHFYQPLVSYSCSISQESIHIPL